MRSSNCVAIIDDDESFCRSTGRMLRAAGLQSVAYLSVEEFLADPTGHRFDCLLVDIQLGGMSGLELQRRLAAEGRRTPIIFITAYDDPKVQAEALDAGCAGYFRKMDEGAHLLEVLRIILPSGRTPPLSGNHTCEDVRADVTMPTSIRWSK